MLPFPIVYSGDYELSLGEHVFPAVKYRQLYRRLLSEGLADSSDFVPPPEASDDDVRLVHTAEWVRKLRTGSLTYPEILRMEVPYSAELVRGFWLSAGGSILAARLALERGAALNPCGGFHHAFPDHGEGFCLIHDVAIAVRRCQKDQAIRRAMLVDVDVHQGNGSAAIFAGDPDVFTLSIHQLNNYPEPKPPSSLDVDLEDGVGDEEYLGLLQAALRKAFASFQPDLVFYLAGADPYREDQLGGLRLSIEGLRRRDDLALRVAFEHGAPVMATLAGGYARRVEDTVTIHANTVLALRDAMALRLRARLEVGATPGGRPSDREEGRSPGAAPTPRGDEHG
jgi:acetoin utilization deacetylase AcuC-like enzyme